MSAAHSSSRRAAAAHWCRARPTGSAALITAAGAWLIVLPFLGTPMALPQAGMAGSAGLGTSAPLLACGLVLLRLPALHSVVGVLAAGLPIVALLTRNIGGLLIGTACGVLGGCLAFSRSLRPTAPTGDCP
ncbi:DUF6114 domain-containing protein [Streptomyces macrosporus]|uniref:Uncharacterized protein n=1 Tax=Streptomyces macrosporus TaxID=44032 RepID=A0ABP5XQI9_9ACTN